jgi:hypothetical protein
MGDETRVVRKYWSLSIKMYVWRYQSWRHEPRTMYQLNLEGGLWPWKERKTIGHTIFSFFAFHPSHFTTPQNSFPSLPTKSIRLWRGPIFWLYFVIVASHMQIHNACLRSTRTYTSQRRLLKGQRGRAFWSVLCTCAFQNFDFNFRVELNMFITFLVVGAE